MRRSLMPRFGFLTQCFVMFMLSTAATADAADMVALQQDGKTLSITINEQPFAVYNFADDLPKPFLLPVKSAAGVEINRKLNDASDADHPHHKGMWNAIDEVNEVKFWAEKGPIRTNGVIRTPEFLS